MNVVPVEIEPVAIAGSPRPSDIAYLRYVIHARLDDYLALGWVVVDRLAGTNHGHYAVLCRWGRDGEPVEPVRES